MTRAGVYESLAVSSSYAKLAIGPPVNERLKGSAMTWTTPTLVEICIGLEINGYLPAEF
jgi:coenzyme PQQ precursor peptide PqqA